MKTFVAVTLFVAFVAVVRATELADDSDKVSFVQCQKNLYNCFKDGNSTKKECLVEYKGCMAALMPTKPYFMTLCKKDLSWCISHAEGIKMQAGCFWEYAVCLKNQGPTPVTYAPDSRAMDEPTRGPFAQCQIDLYDCNNKGDKTTMECLTDYKQCMLELIPPHVEICKEEAKTCYQNASGLMENAQCAADFATCLANGGPTGAY